MPIIEASFEGTPVAYSNIPIHVELFGAVNMLPNNREEAVNKIKSIVESKQLVDVSKFSDEEQIAKQYYQLWRELLD